MPDSAENPDVARHLRLVWPEWQGAGASTVAELAPEFPLDVARRGYTVGTRVLQAILPPHPGPTATVPVPMDTPTEPVRDGVESTGVLTHQLVDAIALIEQHAPDRITTLGGTCSVSVAPFTAMAARYPDDVAVIWIDSHPDIDTGDTGYDGYHAMAVSMITGHGDAEMSTHLPATIPASRVALVGLHEWVDDVFPHIEQWGLATFAPDDLRESSQPLLDWLAATGCSRVAIHFDVDTIAAAEGTLGLGAVPDGLTTDQVRRLGTDLAASSEVVATTVAEFFPRQVIRLQQVLDALPLVSH
ncbi:arginase family protein [Cellulomonas sp. Y8]|uniref:arginase family protein n=1 Tax=Cellulomonas sp. Y8 TaxID=2591145 RepID=UPI003D7336FA